MTKKDLNANIIKSIFERLFINPITRDIPIEEKYYMLFDLLTEENLLEMVELAKRCQKYENAYHNSSSKFSWELNHARQYRNLREEFIKRLRSLNKKIDCNNRRKKIFTGESLEAIGKSFQIEHAKKLKTHNSKKNFCKWVRSGELFSINGFILSDGLFYVGDYFKIPQEYKKKAIYYRHLEYREHNRSYRLSKIYGTVIHADLPISKGELTIVPFSSYLDMHPTHRYEYLQWLSGELKVSDVSKETFLFYLYGLQLRMFIDDSTTEQDRLEIVKHSISLYTQCQEEGIEYYELNNFIDATLSCFYTNSLVQLVPKDLLPQLQLCREAIILSSRNNKNNNIMENICRSIMCLLNHNNSIPEQLLTDSFYVQFADMVTSELKKMSHENNWKRLQDFIKDSQKTNIYVQYCINCPKEYSLLRYDYIFNFRLFPTISSLGFFNQCINNCFKRIVKRIDEYSILTSELPSHLSSSLSLFDTDFPNIHTKIHRIITENEVFSTIENKTDATEYTIEKRATANKHQISLSDERLAKVEKQTKQAQTLLSEIFEDSEEKIDTIYQENNELLNILKILITKESWIRKDVEMICQKRHLMIGSVLEQINDYSYSKINDAVIEDDGETISVTIEYKDQLI